MLNQLPSLQNRSLKPHVLLNAFCKRTVDRAAEADGHREEEARPTGDALDEPRCVRRH